MNGTEYAHALRAIAEWYEAHPDMPVPPKEIGVYGVTETREEAARIALALAPCRKEHGGAFFRLTRGFKGLTLKFVFERSAVCTRRVIRVEEVPEQIIAAHSREIVAWDCEPALLAENSEGNTT